MNTRTLTAVALILAAIPVAGFAQSAPMRPAMPTLDFATADADGSGGISAEEWTAYSTTLRDAMRAEMIGARADALIAAADADGDAALTRDELIAGMTAMHDERGQGRGRGEGRGMRGDWMGGMMGHHGGRGGDDRGEGRGFGRHGGDDHGRRGEMRGEMRGDGQGGRDGQMRGEGRGPGGMGDRMFARIDDNGDGQIDAAELAQAQEFLTWLSQRPGRN